MCGLMLRWRCSVQIVWKLERDVIGIEPGEAM